MYIQSQRKTSPQGDASHGTSLSFTKFAAFLDQLIPFQTSKKVSFETDETPPRCNFSTLVPMIYGWFDKMGGFPLAVINMVIPRSKMALWICLRPRVAMSWLPWPVVVASMPWVEAISCGPWPSGEGRCGSTLGIPENQWMDWCFRWKTPLFLVACWFLGLKGFW